MEREAEPELPQLGWIERAYASVPVSPAMVGAVVAGVLVLAFVVSEFALDRHLVLRDQSNPYSPFLLADAGTAIMHCLGAAYLPTAYIYMLRDYRRTLDRLRGDLDCSDEEMANHLASIGRYGPVVRGLAVLIAVGVMLVGTRLSTPPQFDPWALSAV